MTDPKAKDMTNGELADYADQTASGYTFGIPEINAHIATIHEIAARLRATDWQPIESAPKDNTHILVSFHKPMKSTLNWSSRRVFAAYFSPQANDWCIEGQWVEEQKPNRWTPLPPTP